MLILVAGSVVRFAKLVRQKSPYASKGTIGHDLFSHWRGT